MADSPVLVDFSEASIEFSNQYQLVDVNWKIRATEAWLLLGSNGSGKSALISAMVGEGRLLSGQRVSFKGQTATVSLLAQQTLIERERLRDDSDLTDQVFQGTPLVSLLNEDEPDPVRLEELVKLFGMEALLASGFRKLSTGETRKALLIKALASPAPLLMLDEPFVGLDTAASRMLMAELERIGKHKTIVLVMNHLPSVPAFITHYGYLEGGRLLFQGALKDAMVGELLKRLNHLHKADIELPVSTGPELLAELDPNLPLVTLRNAKVQYADKIIFEDLDWQINQGEHWQLTGPNGSGKTTLLALITGDNPQCYQNDLFLFGYQRGRGESIWDIKRHIGYVSSALQWDYRVSISAENVILSGFFDSIGLYVKASDQHRVIAHQWLGILGMEDRWQSPLNQFSYGDQRLLLIARAMVKRPSLLILDEPCVGLDSLNRQLVLSLIEIICQSGHTTVVYVNHHAEDTIPSIQLTLDLSEPGP
ncbi:MAG: molybdate ABC transporter ATP-binding protein ModF [Gammaproteobacteria bacterium]|nr:molybdate ABC transporter ATP-binding protein ModF [Gammaproteobacteria bacterium]